MKITSRAKFVALAACACLLLVIVSLGIRVHKEDLQREAQSDTRLKKILADAIELYRADHMRLPSTLHDLFSNRPVEDHSEYLIDDCYFHDSEGNPITYRVVGTTNYVLTSPTLDRLGE